jgi:hypothetical protein
MTLKSRGTYMKVYQNFVGIDIGKYAFVVSVFGQKSIVEYENNAEGIMIFLETYKVILLYYPKRFVLSKPQVDMNWLYYMR